MTKWINSIIKCFYDSGTSEEKSKALLLTSLLQLNRIDFDRTRSCYSADNKTSTNNKKWLVDNIIPLEDKNFDNIVSKNGTTYSFKEIRIKPKWEIREEKLNNLLK